MGRRDYQWFRQDDFRGGINQQPENAQPNQVLDARNVWCPNGVLEQRPGYTGVFGSDNILSNSSTSPPAVGSRYCYSYDRVGQTYQNVISSGLTANYLQTGDNIYVGGDGQFNTIVFLGQSDQNTNADTLFKVEYWNGSSWKYLLCSHDFNQSSTQAADADSPIEFKTVPVFKDLGFDSFKSHFFTFVIPADWATTTVNGQVAYWTKFTIVQNNISHTMTFSDVELDYNLQDFTSAAYLQFPRTSRVLLMSCAATSYPIVGNLADLTRTHAWYQTVSSLTSDSKRITSCAVIPDFNEAYFAAGNNLLVATAAPTTTTTVIPTVEDRPEFVGTINGIKSVYHPDYVAQESQVPRGKYLLWTQNQLFVANLAENPFAFRWSAPSSATAIGYRIWPSISYELLSEDDNSPITGLTTLNEQPIIFKGDSIWAVELVGQNVVGLNIYKPRRVVKGIGCISHNSIVQTPAGLVFLSDDGLYLFNGVEATKISKGLDTAFSTANASQSSKAVAVHWQTQFCYLLAIPTNGNDKNDLVVVWDYKHNAFWLWDNMPVCNWLRAEGENDKEEIFFCDYSGNIFKLGDKLTDNGAAVESYVQTHRYGDRDMQSSSFREVLVSGTNDVSSLDVSLIRDDEDSPTTGSLEFTDVAEVAPDVFKFSSSHFASKKRRQKRMMTRSNGQWCSVKVSNSNKNQKMQIQFIAIGSIPLGFR